MRLVMQKAIKMARVDSAALLTGESGVGKDILARFIHKNSLRQGKSFIKINCGAIPETLLESELFGYEKGAFTGARTEGKAGLFEIGQGGTVFLDEIAELPLYLQVKILAVLEDKEITRLGGTKPKHIDFRIIAATNRDLLSLVNSGDFRKDLYFRLSTLPLDLPPLRERRDDIVPLINHFLKKFTRSDQTKKTLTPRAYEILGQYSFPGNVRELMNIVERLVVMSDKKTLGPEDLPAIIQEGTPLSRDRKTPGGLKETVSEFEKGLIEEALKRHKTISRVALAFGVNPSTISRKVQQHGLIRP
jgi:transcriptional regulator with PAS, ATPase and Fis domain